MPNIEAAWRFQDALYWPASGFDAYGNPDVDMTADPVELKVRWEQVSPESLDAQGNTVNYDAVVVVDREIPIGSVFWQGTLDSLFPLGSPPTSELMYVKTYSDIPDIKGRHHRRLVYLMRLADTVE